MQRPENSTIVIFGASGDLAKRKLIPALFDLFEQQLLPQRFAILGVGRTQLDDQSFRQKMKPGLPDGTSDKFLDCLHYQAVDTKSAEDYKILKQRLIELDQKHAQSGNVLYYLSTPPSLYSIIPHMLAAQGLNDGSALSGWKRLIVEKPFGYDLDSAKELNACLLADYDESQVYRIDHYLGKETVQNLMALRFSNGIFEPLWNRNYIHHIEITGAETLGVEQRGGYYDSSGAMRDMVQNHLLQIVAAVAMEPPAKFDSTAVRNEKVKVFQALRPIKNETIAQHVIRGQYTAAKVKGEALKSYRDEDGVPEDSRTETFVAMKFYIDNWRWGGVPFYIRSGKRMPTRVTEAVIHFKKTPHRLFTNAAAQADGDNVLIIRIQPDEGILLKFGMKQPGAGFNIKQVDMDFHYSDLANVKLPEAYERLLLDCLNGDSTLYARADGVEACWEFITPILKAWKNDPSLKVYGYPAGTWGPLEARSLFDDADEDWRYPCKNLTGDGEYCEL